MPVVVKRSGKDIFAATKSEKVSSTFSSTYWTITRQRLLKSSMAGHSKSRLVTTCSYSIVAKRGAVEYLILHGGFRKKHSILAGLSGFLPKSP
mgnify:CR=1 FL=1